MMTESAPMQHNTGIRWTHASGYKGETWNPIRGCSVVSPGCTHCYAMRLAGTRMAGPGGAYEGLAKVVNGHPVWTGEVRLLPHKLEEPLRWTKPRMVFVNSMSDWAHELVPDTFLDQMFDVMERCPQHVFQLLTKRPERARDYMKGWLVRKHYADILPLAFSFTRPETFVRACSHVMPPNIWLGTSVEDQRRADERIPILLDTPASVRFLSAEPLLGPLDLGAWIDFGDCVECDGVGHFDGARCPACGGTSWNTSASLHWVIVGGESGPGFRPMDLDWARDLRDQCVASGVPYFYKQSGGPRTETGQTLDGVRWEQYPLVGQ